MLAVHKENIFLYNELFFIDNKVKIYLSIYLKEFQKGAVHFPQIVHKNWYKSGNEVSCTR